MSLSIFGFIFGILGLFMPALAGIVLDTACTHRNQNKLGVKSNCLIYDNDQMRYIILGVAFVFQIPACFFYILSWLFTPEDYAYKSKSEKDQALKSEIEIQNTDTIT